MTAESRSFIDWHRGRLPWQRAVRAGKIRLTGRREHARALPTWHSSTHISGLPGRLSSRRGGDTFDAARDTPGPRRRRRAHERSRRRQGSRGHGDISRRRWPIARTSSWRRVTWGKPRRGDPSPIRHRRRSRRAAVDEWETAEAFRAVSSAIPRCGSSSPAIGCLSGATGDHDQRGDRVPGRVLTDLLAGAPAPVDGATARGHRGPRDRRTPPRRRRATLGRGLSPVDAHLLTLTLIITPGCRLWTRDRVLAACRAGRRSRALIRPDRPWGRRGLDRCPRPALPGRNDLPQIREWVWTGVGGTA